MNNESPETRQDQLTTLRGQIAILREIHAPEELIAIAERVEAEIMERQMES